MWAAAGRPVAGTAAGVLPSSGGEPVMFRGKRSALAEGGGFTAVGREGAFRLSLRRRGSSLQKGEGGEHL